MKPSKLPWAIHCDGKFGQFDDLGPSICSENGNNTCQPLFNIVGPADANTCRANAELVVEAVNNWDRLMQAVFNVIDAGRGDEDEPLAKLEILYHEIRGTEPPPSTVAFLSRNK